MLIMIDKYFEVEVTQGDFYLKLPWIGQCHYIYGSRDFYWDSWRRLKEVGEV